MAARIVPPSPEGLNEAARRLRNSEVVGIPTETVYGLAGLASDERAVARIFAVKERPTFDPLIVHVALEARTVEALQALGVVSLNDVASDTAARAQALIADVWPGPLTLVLPRGPRVAELVSSGMDTVAVRMPRHPVTLALIREVGPLAAPSANRFGRISPTRASDVVEELGDRVAMVIDGGPCALGLESTVVSLVGPPTLLRPGSIPRERIEALLGAPLEQPRRGTAPAGPGMLASHYAPRVPLVLWDRRGGAEVPLPPGPPPERLGLLLFRGELDSRIAADLERRGAHHLEVRTLSSTGDAEEAARNLFRYLRELDDVSDLIAAEICPVRDGLGPAVQDRLARAAAPRD